MVKSECGERRTRRRIVDTFVNLVRTRPVLQLDEKNPKDGATEPHGLTHGPDARRYYCDGCPLPATLPVERDEDNRGYEEEMRDVLGY